MNQRQEAAVPRRLRPAAAALLLAVCVLLGGFAAPTGASAAEAAGIELRAEAGYQGVVKEGRWMRLRVTLTNRTERSVKGELSFAATQPYDGRTVSYALPAELPVGTPVVLDLTVPGTGYHKDNNRIRFYEGGAGAGDEIPLLTDKPYLETSTTSDTTIGVVARDPDTLNFMALLNQQGYNVRVVPIDEAELPEQAALLDSFDFLVLNDVATGGWSAQRQHAVKAWVQRGGWLVVAGGAGYAKTAEAFADLVPVEPEGTAALTQADNLNELGGGNPLPSSPAATLSVGRLAAGVVTVAEQGTPIAAERPYGKGQVVYAAFDPSLEPFASWNGSPELWARILSGALVPLVPGAAQAVGFGDMNWEINNLLDYFPSIQPPPVGLLAVFFAVYILLVAPALYLLLKAVDRREWAWWIIPLVSVASSVVIFSVGAADKSATLAHSLRTVELSGAGEGMRTASAALFVPSGGRVAASFEPGVSLRPYPETSGGGMLGNGSMGGGAQSPNGQVVRSTPDATSVEWRDVPYWSVRKAKVQYDYSEGLGQFDIATEYDSGHIKIDVTNRTGTDLTDVALLVAGVVYKLSDLKQDESASVAIPPVNAYRYGGYYDYGGQLFPYSSAREDDYRRERGLLNAYMNVNEGMGPSARPVIVGFSRDNESWFAINGRQAHTDNLTLWVQPFEMYAGGDGEVAVLPGTLNPVITSNKLNNYSVIGGSGRIDIGEGELEFEFKLPWSEGAAYDKLIVYNAESRPPDVFALSIWNEREQRWDPLDTEADRPVLPGAAGDYVTSTNAVRMKLESRQQMRYVLPSIGLEGKVNG